MEAASIQELEETMIFRDFEEFIILRDHPCLMAQAVFSERNLNFHVYPELGTQSTAKLLLRDLKLFLDSYNAETDLVFTFLAVFKGRNFFSEKEFEQLLWKQLQLLHEADNRPWDKEVSSDPEASDFSFSIAGKSFYLVGLHPNSSRKARQSPYPAIAFNLHSQFENLRKKGRYDQIKKRIRLRDLKLQGNLNPMLQDFNEGSEARQYSGRKVGEDWKCPFLHKKIEHVPAEKIPENR